MDFLRKLIGGGNSAADRDRAGMYFYVKPNGCSEIVRVRINANNDPSLEDDGKTYYVHKTVRADDYRCNRPAELELFFDSSRRLQKTEITSGTLVTKEDYDDWVASKTAAPNTP
jgi:hypothetical protein